jgi:effector-binding domain-containing protein
MIDPPTIVKTAATRAAIVHLTIPKAAIQKEMGPGIAEVRAALAAQDIEATGPWFTRHYKMDPEVWDFDIGVPVAKPVAPTGRVQDGELPAATVARTIYHGGYEGLAGAWPKLDAWIAEQGRTGAASLWETYLVDPVRQSRPRGLADGALPSARRAVGGCRRRAASAALTKRKPESPFVIASKRFL